jgi:excisionase family DNA binding protein
VCGQNVGMTNGTDLAAAPEAFIRDEVAWQVEEQVALQIDELTRAAKPPAASESRWLSTREAAARVGCHEDTVRKACQTGELFAKQRLKYGTWAIRSESVDAWMDGTPDPHREAVERWQRGPKQPLKPRKRRPRPTEPDPDGPAAA